MADSSKDIQLRELKDMINDLKKMIKTLQATVDAGNKRKRLTQERDNLKEEIDLLRKIVWHLQRKRTLDIPGQLNFLMRRNWNRIQKLQKQRFLNQFFQKNSKSEKEELQMRNVLRSSC